MVNTIRKMDISYQKAERLLAKKFYEKFRNEFRRYINNLYKDVERKFKDIDFAVKNNLTKAPILYFTAVFIY